MWKDRVVCVVALTLIPIAACNGKGEGAPQPAASAAAPIEKKPPEVIRFVGHPVEIGQKWKTKRRSLLDLSVEFFDQNRRWGTSDSTRDEQIDMVDEVLGRIGARPAKVKTHYAVHRVKENHPDRGKREDAILEGRTFILDVTEGKPVATDVDGKPVPETEAESLWAHHADLGKDDEVVRELGVRAIRVGDKMNMKVSLFRAFIGTTTGEYESGHVTVVGVEGEGPARIADVRWTAKMKTQEDNGMITDWDIKGTSTVTVQPARLVSQSIEAQLTVSGRTHKDGTELRMDGAGVMKDSREISLEGP